MAKGFKSGGRDFKKGEVANPGGRPKLPADVKKAKRINQVELQRILNEILAETQEQFLERKRKANTTKLEQMVCALVDKAIQHGDQSRLNMLLDRLVGKVKDTIEHEFPDPTIIHIPGGGRLELGSKRNTDDEPSTDT